MPEVQRRARGHPGRAGVPGDPAVPARRRPVPGGVRDLLHRRYAGGARLRPADPGQGRRQRHVRLPAPAGRQDRPAAVRVHPGPGQDRLAGPQPGADRQRPGRRWWGATTSTSSTSPGAATRSSPRSSGSGGSTPASWRTSTSPGPNGNLMPAQHRGDAARLGGAALAQPLPAAQRGEDLGVAIRPLDRRCSVLEDAGGRILPKGYALDYTGESRQLAQGRQHVPARLRRSPSS